MQVWKKMKAENVHRKINFTYENKKKKVLCFGQCVNSQVFL